MNTEPEIMERVDELLRVGNRRRALEKAVQDLRNQKKQSIFWSVLPVSTIAALLTDFALRNGLTAQIGGKTVLFILGIALLTLCVGLICMQAYSKRRDKLLLMLAEEVLKNNVEPGKSAEK